MIGPGGRRRAVAALAGLIGAGFVLSGGASVVNARPIAVIEQVPLGEETNQAPGSEGFGSHASVSGDGRFVAYQGLPPEEALAAGDTRTSTVYLTDRESQVTTEVTPVPDGVRAGGSIHPVLSGDGCSIAVVTEMPLDVFRDDDTGNRWDVYRLSLAHCGGLAGAWELVSSRNAGDALARDDVSTVDPPAVSRGGTLIAYTHPANEWYEGDGLSNVTLVDLEQPVVSSERSRLVAGTPVASPETQFVHGGIDQPAISGDGRFVLFRSDAASTDAVAGWGTGQAAGGPATRQIFAWDRSELDPFSAVRLLSVRAGGEPSPVGASDPVVSRDGRVIAFTSADVALVDAVFPPCAAEECPDQVFRVDRDVDENGRYDERGRTATTIVSAVAGEPVVAGTAPSSQPTISADGQLVAFITKASNLQVVQANGGGESTDGDLLVADARIGTLRRVTVLADGVRPAIGSHSGPQLSDTGRTTVFDTLAAPQLVSGGAPTRQVVSITTLPDLSLADADLGSTLVGFASDEWYVAIINNGPATFTPTKIEMSDPRFGINRETSTCGLGAPVPPGGDCTVRFNFTPDSPVTVSASLTVSEEGFQAVSVTSEVRGTGGEPALRSSPGGAELGDVVVGTPSLESVFDIENISMFPTSVASVRLTGAHASDFAVTSNSCAGKPLNPRSTCSIGLTFTPTAPGHRSALVLVESDDGGYTSVVVGGDGRFTATLDVDPAEIDAGGKFLTGGNGFPPNSAVSLFFGDDPANAITATTNEHGSFLMWFDVVPNERGGPRTLVAQAADSTVASAAIVVVEQPDLAAGMPGFGLGG